MYYASIHIICFKNTKNTLGFLIFEFNLQFDPVIKYLFWYNWLNECTPKIWVKDVSFKVYFYVKAWERKHYVFYVLYYGQGCMYAKYINN